MEKIILEKIKEIENKHHVTVLLACETGSRAWGFPSPDSDYDIRLIYHHPIDWYLSLSEKSGVIEYMSSDGLIDVSGWELKKSLQLMWKSNGALFERLQSPIIYKIDEIAIGRLFDSAQKCFSPIASMHHYMGMAKNSYADILGQKEIKLKKLFYALRATLGCKWILERNSIVPIDFIKMVDELQFELNIKDKIRELIELKSIKNEDYIHPAEREINSLIERELAIAEKAFDSLPGRNEKYHDLDNVFRSILKRDYDYC